MMPRKSVRWKAALWSGSLCLAVAVGLWALFWGPSSEVGQAGEWADANASVANAQTSEVPSRDDVKGDAGKQERQVFGRTVVTVVRSSGDAVVGARLILVGPEMDTVLGEASEIARSSTRGRIQIEPTGGLRSFYVHKDGFVPAFLRDVSDGEHRRVVLQAASRQVFRFETVGGVPVAGVSASVSSRSLTSRESRMAGKGQFYSAAGGRSMVASTPVSNAVGISTLSLTGPGKYWLRINLEGSGYILSNTGDCVQITVPSRPKIVKLQEIIGSAIEFVGAEVLVIRRNRGYPSPFGKPRPVPELLPVDQAKKRLHGRFPDAKILLGVKKPGEEVLQDLHLSVLKASGEVEKVQVPLQHLSEILETQVVQLRPVSRQMTSLVTFRILQTEAHALPNRDLPGIRVRIMRDGERFTMRCKSGESLVLPRGIAYVIPDRDVLDSGFEAVKIDVQQAKKQVELVQKKRLLRYSLRILLPNGKPPQRCAVGLRRTMYGRPASSSIYVQNGSATFWTSRKELKVKVDTRGCKSNRAVLKASHAKRIDGILCHVIQMEWDQ